MLQWAGCKCCTHLVVEWTYSLPACLSLSGLTACMHVCRLVSWESVPFPAWGRCALSGKEPDVACHFFLLKGTLSVCWLLGSCSAKPHSLFVVVVRMLSCLLSCPSRWLQKLASLFRPIFLGAAKAAKKKVCVHHQAGPQLFHNPQSS